MEQNQNTQAQTSGQQGDKALTDRQILLEIYRNTLKTKNYMKWSLYITIVLVVLPLLAALVIVPFVFKSLGSTYGAALQ